MLYHLEDLLTKMGAPETKEKGRMCWHYFNSEPGEEAGFAEVRLSADGMQLMAELQHLRHDYIDDAGDMHPSYTESFYMHAEQQGAYYKVTKIAFDGEEYAHPSKSVIELGLSLFHARALDISILMVEQTFNKEDILNPTAAFVPQALTPRRKPAADIPSFLKPVLEKQQQVESWGVVVPFRPRSELRRSI